MKKLVLIYLGCLTLFGCNDNEITNRYLIGSWECTCFDYRVLWKDGIYQNFGNFPEQKEEKIPTKFYMKNERLWIDIGKISSEFNLYAFYEKRPPQKTSIDVTIERDDSIEYLSRDKFKITTIIENRYDHHEKDNFKLKTELYCKRINE
ncbi:hypothetical protein A9G11_10080 [Gilliamella sp. wkB108]|uniref:hypothetical protein n=1 Tax=Gilliamella sp. wkB108 TaxID=3120256 RepID=UPI00080E945C|nr:hypothetical protein [Gilliamella apicola]OCG28788.1 hypothetical protein A9G11_10080 [Gilliamella apicola]